MDGSPKRDESPNHLPSPFSGLTPDSPIDEYGVHLRPLLTLPEQPLEFINNLYRRLDDAQFGGLMEHMEREREARGGNVGAVVQE